MAEKKFYIVALAGEVAVVDESIQAAKEKALTYFAENPFNYLTIIKETTAIVEEPAP